MSSQASKHTTAETDVLIRNKKHDKVPTNKVLRLRGGAPTEDDNSSDMDLDLNVPKKRPGAESPETSTGNKKAKAVSNHRESMGSFNNLLGWCETTVTSEVEMKKLSKTTAEGLMDKLKTIRGLFTEVCLENSRLTGALHTSEEVRTKDIMSIFVTATERITARLSENKELMLRNKELERQIQNQKGEPSTSTKLATKPQTDEASKSYAAVTSTAKKPISNKVKKAASEKCRKTKTTSRFVIEVPVEKTIAEAKTEIWKMVSAKNKNPRARTIVKGNTLITHIT